MTSPIFDRQFDPQYGTSVTLSPRVRRVVARNPSAFTFYGTGTYIIGRGTVAVIDPGPMDIAHLEALTLALKGETVQAILVTHTHNDHSQLAAALEQATGAPTYGFGPHGAVEVERVEEGADYSFNPDHRLVDGDCIHGPDWTLQAVHTPGHTSNHLCYALVEEKALFSGDHVMGWSTSVISPPDGDMAAYVASLEKLLLRDDVIYYPTHGNPVRNPKRHVQSFIAHRRDREDQILDCLATGHNTVAAMVPAMYRDVPQKLHPAAARSVLAHLIHMADTRRIRFDTEIPTMDSRFDLLEEGNDT